MDNELKQRGLNEYPAQILSYLGDAVLELLVRERLAEGHKIAPERLHDCALAFVSATAQSKALENIMDILTEDELDCFRRGRNNNKGKTPRSASTQEYRRATGFECLFGYLHLCGRTERMKLLFDRAYAEEITGVLRKNP